MFSFTFSEWKDTDFQVILKNTDDEGRNYVAVHKLNTLKHYKVYDGATMALLNRVSQWPTQIAGYDSLSSNRSGSTHKFTTGTLGVLHGRMVVSLIFFFVNQMYLNLFHVKMICMGFFMCFFIFTFCLLLKHFIIFRMIHFG